MNTSEGLTRIASAVRWMGLGLGALCTIGAVVGAVSELMSEGKFTNAATVFGILLGCAAFFAGGGAGFAWIIDGFAAPKTLK